MINWVRGIVQDWRTLRRQRACGHIGHAWLYHHRPPRLVPYTARSCNCCGVIEGARYDGNGNSVFGWGENRKVCEGADRAAGREGAPRVP